MTRLILLMVLFIPVYGRSFFPSHELCSVVTDAISDEYTPEDLCSVYNGSHCHLMENLGQAVCAAMNKSFCASFAEGQALCVAGHGERCNTVPHFAAGLCAILREPECARVEPSERAHWELRFRDACTF